MKFAILACTCLLLTFPGSAATDAALVGTWEMMVPNQQGVAHWVWEIRANGTYVFHAEGPGAPAGQTMMQANGKLGGGWWRKVQAGEKPPAIFRESRSILRACREACPRILRRCKAGRASGTRMLF